MPSNTAPDILSSRITALLPGLLQLAVSLPSSGWLSASLYELCCLQEAENVDNVIAYGLIKAALQVPDGMHLKALLRCLPAVQQLNTAAVLQLLLVAVNHGPSVVRQLCKLPVLQVNSSGGSHTNGDTHSDTSSDAAWLELLAAAVEADGIWTAKSVCELPAVRAAVRDADALQPLLHAAAHRRAHALQMLSILLELPAAADTKKRCGGSVALLKQVRPSLRIQLRS